MKPERKAKLTWLEALVHETDRRGCRDWPWGLSAKGYGFIYWEGRQQRVGHVVLSLSGFPRPFMRHQLHSCDRPSCVAPWHLRWGTNAENRHESVERGRQASKLTEGQVREIYAARGVTQRELAATYGVDQKVICGIRNGTRWQRVTSTIHPPSEQGPALWLEITEIP